MSDLMLTSSVAISASAVFLFVIMALDYIVQKRLNRKRSRLYPAAANQGYQEPEVSKN